MTRKQIAQTAVFAALVLGLLLSAPISQVQADDYVPTQPTKEITLDKMVGRPNNNSDVDYVDNLSSSDYAFTSAQIIFFRLKVKNTSQARLTDVVVKDFNPTYVGLVNDPGTVSNGTLTINAGNFEPGEEKVYVIRGRVDNNPDNIPAGTTCVTNTARAEANGVSAQDSAQFCVRKPGTTPAPETKGGVPVPTKVPATGAADGLFILGGALSFAIAGFKLRKLA